MLTKNPHGLFYMKLPVYNAKDLQNIARAFTSFFFLFIADFLQTRTAQLTAL